MKRNLSILFFVSVAAGAFAQEAAAPGDLDALFAHLFEYEVGADGEALQAIADRVIAAQGNAEARADLEQRLIAILNTDASSDAKQFVCKQLRLIGSAACVPVLSEVVLDPDNADSARYVLQQLPFPEAAAALREALPKASDMLKVGILNSLGDNQDAEAVPDIAKMTNSDDPAVVLAAIAALGKVGSADAADALHALRDGAPENLRPALDTAYLNSAGRLLDAGNREGATTIYSELNASDAAAAIRFAALRGLVSAQGEAAMPAILAALKSDDAHEQANAMEAAGAIPGSFVTETLVAQFDSLPAQAKIYVVHGLAARGDRAALPVLTGAADAGDEALRMAALTALSRIADDASAKLLLERAAKGPEAEQRTARQSLASMPGDPADRVSAAALETGDAAVRAQAARTLGTRRSAKHVDALLKAAADADASVQTAAFGSLAELAGDADAPALIALLTHQQNDEVSAAAESALGAVIGRAENPIAVAAPLLAALPSTGEGRARAAALRLLVKTKSPDALKAILADTGSDSDAVRGAAIRALAEWPTAEPADALLKLADHEDDAGIREAILRGYLRMLEIPQSRSSEDTIKLYEKAFKECDNANEEKLVLAGLGNQTDPRCLELVSEYFDDDDVKAEAMAAAQKLQKAGFSPSASLNAGEARLAVDGDVKTRWATGTSQTPGQWFAVDLGWTGKISKVTLDAAASSQDYPRGYEVYVSGDGKDWGGPVAKGEGTGALTEIAFSPTQGRFIRIVQTGAVDGLYWSIHELTVEVR